MNLVSPQVLQLLAWFMALISFILSLYIIVLNPRHIANRHVSGLLLIFAVNLFAVGAALAGPELARLALPLQAATVPAIQPALFLVAVALIKPQLLRGKWRYALWPVYALVFLPIFLTAIDLLFHTGLWYTGIDLTTYGGGFVELGPMTAGALGGVVRLANIYLMGIVPLLFLLYEAVFDKELETATRRLAWLLFGTQTFVVISQFALRGIFGSALTAVVTGLAYVAVYAYAAFQQMISERRAQGGRLQSRLTILILVVAVPLLVAVAVFTSLGATELIEQKATEELARANQALAVNLSTWLDLNVQALDQLVSLPDIVSMVSGRQEPVLQTMDAAHPHMYLVSTTDNDGINVARSDGADAKDYSDRDWVSGARGGALTLQVLVGRTSGEPALVASLPIRDAGDAIIGVGMFASDLDKVTQAVKVTQVGDTGFAYVVDEFNQVVVHPDSEYAATLQDLSSEPAVEALRNGARGAVLFADADGKQWRAHVDELDNGWGVIVQEPASELLGSVGGLPPISWLVIVAGVLVLATLTTLTVRQSIRPIDSLTDTAIAITAGDLEREAPVESDDELGILARSFNSMTSQLRELIGGLEAQVTERTQDLEQRTSYLEATAEVGRAAASILDTDELIEQVVELIRDRFGLYYVGLFMVDEAGEWAVLRAGTGEAGRAMRERGHRIQVGAGMIGWSVAHSQPRIASEAGADAIRLATPELPETRSEAALPLRSRGQVLGALTVQHTEAGAFDDATIAALQTMADQVALALNNAQLFDDSQQALEATRLAYGEMSRQAWASQGRSRTDWGYRYAQRTVDQAEGEQSAEMVEALRTGRTQRGQGAALAVPVMVRDQMVGVLGFRKGESGEDWTAGEIELLETFAEQLAIALESARLYEETQNRAAREQMAGQITARMRETLDVDTVLQAAVREIGDVLRLHDIQIQLELDGESTQGSTTSPARQEVS